MFCLMNREIRSHWGHPGSYLPCNLLLRGTPPPTQLLMLSWGHRACELCALSLLCSNPAGFINPHTQGIFDAMSSTGFHLLDSAMVSGTELAFCLKTAFFLITPNIVQFADIYLLRYISVNPVRAEWACLGKYLQVLLESNSHLLL